MKKEDPSSNYKCKNPKKVIKGQRNKLCYRTPYNYKKHIRKGKGREN
jgi:hypothetical protein